MRKVIETSYAGINVFWKSGEADYIELTHNLGAAGFTGITLDRKSERAALSDALHKLFSKSHRRLIRPLGNKAVGYGVYREEVNTDGESLNHIEILRVKVVSGQLIFSGDKYDSLADKDRNKIAALVGVHFDQEKDKVSDAQVTRLLVRQLNSLQGVSLRPRGGIYWLNTARVGEWERFATVVEASATMESSIEVYRQNVAMDDDAIRAVSAALTHEISKTVDEIKSEVGAGNAGNRRLKTLGGTANKLHDKIREYESLFGVALQSLHEAANDAAKTAAFAAMQTMGA